MTAQREPKKEISYWKLEKFCKSIDIGNKFVKIITVSTNKSEDEDTWSFNVWYREREKLRTWTNKSDSYHL